MSRWRVGDDADGDPPGWTPTPVGVADWHPVAFACLNSSCSDASDIGALAQTLISAGEPLILSANACWRQIGRIALQSLPGVQPLELTPDEVRGVLRRSGRLVALYPSDESQAQPLLVFVARRQGHGPGRQQRQFRQKLRVGLRVCTVGPLSWQELELEGVAVNRAAVAARRSGHHSWCQPQLWRRYCRALADDSRMSAWGCRVEGQLAAFLLLWQQARTVHGLALQWNPALAWAHPTHCLYDGVLNGLFHHGEIDAVVAGRQTLPPRPDLDRFKRHAGFLPEPIGVQVIAHPLLAPWLRGEGTAKLLRRLMRLGSRRWPTLAYLEPLARICEQAAW